MTSDLAWSSALFRLSARQEGSSAGSGMGPKRRDVARGCTYCAEAEIYERHAVLTLDSDFSVYRKDRCRARTHPPGEGADSEITTHTRGRRPSVHAQRTGSPRLSQRWAKY